MSYGTSVHVSKTESLQANAAAFLCLSFRPSVCLCVGVYLRRRAGV